jgi:hypothetical protein
MHKEPVLPGRGRVQRQRQLNPGCISKRMFHDQSLFPGRFLMTSSSKLILFAGGLAIGVALTAVLFAGRAEAQRTIGSYAIRNHSNPNALAGVFRVNQATGYISYCYINASGTPQVTCTPETP